MRGIRPVKLRVARAAGGLALALLLCAPLPASSAAGDLPAISIIIDDMGYRLQDGRDWMVLPGPLAFSFLPHAPHTLELSDMAARRGDEILLHLPMEAQDHSPMGPGGISADMNQDDIARVLDYALTSVPHAIGINNHMGSLMTSDPDAVDRLMRAVSEYGNLFFIDSRTTAQTVAEASATEHQIPALRRDVFLDYERGEATVRHQFRTLVATAHRQGWAVAIAHPFPETLKVLAEELPKLEQYGVRLEKLSKLVAHKQRSDPSWQLSSSHSHRAAKNLKQ